MIETLLEPTLAIPLILLILIFGVGDLLSTKKFLDLSVCEEGNPIGKLLLKYGGFKYLIIFKMIGILFIIYLVLLDNKAIISVYFLIVISLFIVLWNCNHKLVRKYIPDKILIFIGLLEYKN